MDIAHVRAIEAHEAEYRQKMREVGEWDRRSLRELGDKIGHDNMRVYLDPAHATWDTSRFIDA